MNTSTSIGGLDSEEVVRLSEDFDHYDRDKDGLMEYGEFVRFLSKPNSPHVLG